MKAKIAAFFAFNLMGKFVPPIVGLAVLPLLLQYLGKEKFGEFGALMSVMLMLSILDFGITKSLVRKLAANNLDILSLDGSYRDVYWGAFLFQISLGLIGAGVALSFFFWLGYLQSLYLFDATSPVQYGLLILGFSLAVASGVSRAFYEGRNRFGELNIIRSIFSVLTYLSPVFTLIIFNLESWVFCTVMIVKSCESLLLLGLVLKREKICFSIAVNFSPLRLLLPFGVWVMLSNILNPLIAYGERFVVISVLGLTVFSDYYVAIELITRLLIIVGALSTATFTLESKFAANSKTHADLEFIPYVVASFYTLLSIMLFFEAGYLLEVWLGIEDISGMVSVTKILTVGLIFNAVAFTFLNKVYAEGGSKHVFYSYCVQMPLFLCVVWWLSNSFGLVGVAVAWSARVIIDFLILLFIKSKFSWTLFKTITIKLLSVITLVAVLAFSAFWVLDQWANLSAVFRIILEIVVSVCIACVLFLVKPIVQGKTSYA